MQTKKIKVEDREIEVRELLVKDVEEIFADSQKGIDIITDALLGRPQGEKKLLTMCTDLIEEELGKLGFEDFTLLAEAMKEVNPRFFGTYQKKMESLAKLGEIIAQRGSSAIPEPSSGSSGKGTETP